MDQETREQFEILTGMMEKMMSAMATKADINKAIRDSETHMRIYIENSLAARIDSLFDGYKLANEKQNEMEREMNRKTQSLQNQVDALQARLAKLESQIGA